MGIFDGPARGISVDAYTAVREEPRVVFLKGQTGSWGMYNNYESIETKVRDMCGVKTRQMFGYRCFLVSGKVFAGFDNKSDFRVIMRLPRDQQEIAIKHPAIKPFSHGAKMGWAEMDSRLVTIDIAMKWILKGYAYAERLAGTHAS